ncbi:MAG: hypothetical protein HYW48_11620 [Deltaproteobacteria bacterium]|nr:hypothetical protein [Deltaproteobacteria bacterium]
MPQFPRPALCCLLILFCISGLCKNALAADEFHSRVNENNRKIATVVAYATILGHARRAASDPWEMWEQYVSQPTEPLGYIIAHAARNTQTCAKEDIFEIAFTTAMQNLQKNPGSLVQSGIEFLPDQARLEKIYGKFQDPRLKEEWRPVIQNAESRTRAAFQSGGIRNYTRQALNYFLNSIIFAK